MTFTFLVACFQRAFPQQVRLCSALSYPPFRGVLLQVGRTLGGEEGWITGGRGGKGRVAWGGKERGDVGEGCRYGAGIAGGQTSEANCAATTAVDLCDVRAVSSCDVRIA